MKSLLSSLVLAFAILLALPLLNASDQKKLDADLDKARELFPMFEKLLESDPEKAKEPFEQFLQMEDPLQLRLQTWLDTKWIEKRREYERAAGSNDPGGSGGLSISQKETIRENRELLLEIRSLSDEGEMKERLKAKGGPALDKLLVISKRNTGGAPKAEPSEEEVKKTASLLEELIKVGEFRYEIRSNRNQPAENPYQELGLPDPFLEEGDSESDVAAVDSIEADRANREVLAENEKIKGEIPRAEYEGILELNQWRIALGLNALLIDPKLCEAARDHSKDMKTMGFFAHESPVKGKETPWARAANFDTKASSENIAINNSPAAANMAWFYSPGHHKNMFASGRSYVGLGIVDRHYTQLFR